MSLPTPGTAGLCGAFSGVNDGSRRKIGENTVEALALLRRINRQRGADLAGGDPREHGERLDPLVVVGDPIDDLTTVLAELIRRHMRVHETGI